MIALVASLAAAAAAAAVGGVLLQTDGQATPSSQPARPTGRPPLLLDLGVRTDREARDLRRGETLVADGQRAQAAAIFERYPSTEGRVGLALARWPDGSVAALRRLAAEHPRSALVRLNLGFALFWSGARAQAVEQWREAERLEPDTLSAVRADDLLHPNTPRGRPVFVPSRPFSERIASLSANRQLAELAAAAAEGGAAEKLQYGVVLQRLGRPLSARRVYDEAASLAPNDPEALVAAAVGRYDKDDPAAAFSRLGPLARRFPDVPTVRFHLGLLLLWTGAVDEAKEQLERAEAIDPTDPLAREANRFLTRLADAGTD
jgi:tetratricopeptide (TPR) repeat protein